MGTLFPQGDDPMLSSQKSKRWKIGQLSPELKEILNKYRDAFDEPPTLEIVLQGSEEREKNF